MSFDGYRTIAGKTSLMAAVGLLLLTAPARAEGVKDSVLGFFNMGGDSASSDAPLDYRPRAPLVIPPKMDLPSPQQAATLPSDWPVDPDANRRRKALIEPHRRAPGADKPDPAAARQAAAALKEKESCRPAKGDDSYCLVSSPWTYITDKFGMGADSSGSGVLLTGEEPNRKYLTDPPSGYRVPSDPVEMPKDKNGKVTVAGEEEKPGMLSSLWNKLSSD